MKIPHASALVGYLAVIALPFYPFAFASPLAAIDYGGYVNTMQNHTDRALMNHVPGVIEARQLDYVDVVIIIDIVLAVTTTILWIRTDNPVRVLVNHRVFG